MVTRQAHEPPFPPCRVEQGHPVKEPLLLRLTSGAVNLVGKGDEEIPAAQGVTAPADMVDLPPTRQIADLDGATMPVIAETRSGVREVVASQHRHRAKPVPSQVGDDPAPGAQFGGEGHV